MIPLLTRIHVNLLDTSLFGSVTDLGLSVNATGAVPQMTEEVQVERNFSEITFSGIVCSECCQ